MENKQISESTSSTNENGYVGVNNLNTVNESKFINLELGDVITATNSNNSTNYNNYNTGVPKPNVTHQTNTQANNTALNNQTNSPDVLLLNFILKSISNGFKPTKAQVSFILKNKNITDTDSVNYWFRLFVERLIKINRNKKRF